MKNGKITSSAALPPIKLTKAKNANITPAVPNRAIAAIIRAVFFFNNVRFILMISSSVCEKPNSNIFPIKCTPHFGNLRSDTFGGGSALYGAAFDAVIKRDCVVNIVLKAGANCLIFLNRQRFKG